MTEHDPLTAEDRENIRQAEEAQDDFDRYNREGESTPMRVTIHGPNLNDQSKGAFRIHAAGCLDNHREVVRNGSVNPWTVNAVSRTGVTYEVYGDQINEGASYESCRNDLYFAPCCKQLPERSADR